jgi:MarR family transcriptional regulator, temperature-dependent positive regulator of motility
LAVVRSRFQMYIAPHCCQSPNFDSRSTERKIRMHFPTKAAPHEVAGLSIGSTDTGEGLSEIYASPGHVIRRLQQVAVSFFRDAVQVRGLDITPVQYAALRAIAAYPGLDQAALAGAIAYDRATIGGVIERLEVKGLVRRSLSSQDRRVRVLFIEEAGKNLLTHLVPVVREIQEQILEPLTSEERSDFMRLSSKLADAGNERSPAPLRPLP